MKKVIVIAIIAGLIWFLHHNNPTFTDHKNAISSSLRPSSKVWDDLEYKNYYVISIVSSDSKLSMVSIGALKRVEVIDEEWPSKK